MKMNAPEDSQAAHVGSIMLDVPERFSLRTSSAPVWWVGHRNPRQAWIDNTLVHVEREGERIILREVRQDKPGQVTIASNSAPEADATWFLRMFNSGLDMPRFDDPVIADLAERYPGLFPFSDGSLFNGLLTAIIGQSVSLASAAAAQHKLARSFGEGVVAYNREFWPLPTAEQLADASIEIIRACGVTWKRAEAILHIAREQVAGSLPDDDIARERPDEIVTELLKLPLVGKWTAESVLLWGIGAPNAYPPGDVALLRAARKAYGRPDMSMNDLHILAEQWQPARSIAARLLWTDLLGQP